MGQNKGAIDISDLVRRRRELIKIERSFFKSRTNTSIEILTLLTENEFSARLSEIYEQTKATDVSVRQHLRALERLKLIETVDVAEDRRAKLITLTDHGRAHLLEYAKQLDAILTR